jgi:hypothetical protein
MATAATPGRTTDRMPRAGMVVAMLAVALTLVAGSAPRMPGDGGEYVAMALNFASFDGPPLSRRSMTRIEQRIATFEPGLSAWSIEQATVSGGDLRRDFLHFWFYPLLATPGVWVTEALNVSPVYAFAALNCVLLSLALIAALPRIGAAASLLLFAGPILWWIDKPHTEVFTFSLLTIAFATLQDRPWWALIAAGAAATQNPPITVLAPALAVGALAFDRGLLRDRRFLAGAATGFALALVHPVYTYLRYGTPSLLLRATRAGLPDFAEVSAVVLDPQIGLLSSYPALGLVIAASIVLVLRKRPRAFAAPDMLLAGGVALFFLYSFARTTNIHHGATPGLSRYGLWLVPLAVPVLMRAGAIGGPVWTRFMFTTATISAVVCLFAYHPRFDQNVREPSWLAGYLWQHHPAWNNPLPEIFIETTLRREDQWAPIATRGCEKLLVVGGTWPIPCMPGDPPPACGSIAQGCYANRGAAGYSFAPAPGRPSAIAINDAAAWPAESVPHVRRTLERWDWWALRPRHGDLALVRAIHDVRAHVFEGPRHVVIVLVSAGRNAMLTLRPGAPLSGEFVDPATGTSVAPIAFDGPVDEPWTLVLPPGYASLLLRLDIPRGEAR